MVLRLSDAKEFGEFEEQDGMCRCNPTYEHWIATQIRRIEVPMCPKMLIDGVRIGRRGASLTARISKCFWEKFHTKSPFQFNLSGTYGWYNPQVSVFLKFKLTNNSHFKDISQGS